jgi:hypothetical protein
MRFTINYLIFLSYFSLFMACKNEPSSQKNTPSVSDASKASKTNFYRHFRGKIGDFPVTMDIVETKTAYDFSEFPRFTGYYSYDKYQEPMSIYGQLDSTGYVQLEELGRGTTTGFFKGKLNLDSTFTGVWTDTLKHLSYNFSLRETTADGSIAMEIFPFEDSLKLFDNTLKGPQAMFSMDALLPAKNTEQSVFDFLRTGIFKHLKGDSTAMDYANLQISDVQKNARDAFFNTYKTELKEEKQDTNDDAYARLNFSQAYSMDIVSNSDGLLSLGFKSYSFSGGAHGNHGTQLMTFDVINKKKMTLDDVFKPNYKTALNAALMRSARRYFGVKPNQSLQGVSLVEEVEANDNFAINRKGILFDYPPYEIASYAQGEIQLFIPFEDLKSILK